MKTIITGTGHSGTSLTASMFYAAGVEMGLDGVNTGYENDTRSNYDHYEGALEKLLFKEVSWRERVVHCTPGIENKLRCFLLQWEEAHGNVPCAWKMGRALFVLPILRALIGDELRIVICRRDFDSQVASLVERNDLSVATACNVIDFHEQLIRHYVGLPQYRTVEVWFGAWMNQPECQLGLMLQSLGLSWTNVQFQAALSMIDTNQPRRI